MIVNNIPAEAAQQLQDQIDLFMNEGYGNFPECKQLIEDINESMDEMLEEAYQVAEQTDDEIITTDLIDSIADAIKCNPNDGHRQLYLYQVLVELVVAEHQEQLEALADELAFTQDLFDEATSRIEELEAMI